MEIGTEIPSFVAIQLGLEEKVIGSRKHYFWSQHHEIFNAKGICLLICR